MFYTSKSYLSQLPVELLFEIFLQCPDLSSLWSLLNTSSRMRAAFNSKASDIVDSVLNLTVPVQSRLYMRQVLVLCTGLHSYSNLEEVLDDKLLLTERIVATPAQLRRFVALCHRVHVLAHLCIDKSLQRCLDSPLGQKEYSIDFKQPTWTEEQRSILSFWRVLYVNELKLTGLEGRLDWCPYELKRLQNYSFDELFLLYTPKFQTRTALRFIRELIIRSDSEEDIAIGGVQRPFNLPGLPEGTEFGWKCQSPPSPSAVNQGWHPADPVPEGRLSGVIPRPHSEQMAVFFDYESQSESESNIEQINEDSEGDGSETDESERHHPQIRRICRLRDPSPGEPRATVRIVPHPPKDPDIIPPVSLPIQHFGQVPNGEEWRKLHGEVLGVQFWHHARADYTTGPIRFIRPVAYIKYGFAIWEEQRMIDMGLWSPRALIDASDYLKIWYSFLSQEDLNWHDNRRRTYTW
ncbi:hypothetical protein BDV25DRAFT_154794 [Aspergillus avenaceus]|uniref:F-box domain-containing protein n=1 Tax=Aspergillus avenaceus TaxID=36643 RepID=A0A5N6TV03_ASPAV|nr:hypothetical protein BDV25DRAFT_154794 [Aspergillus avenaceus]